MKNKFLKLAFIVMIMLSFSSCNYLQIKQNDNKIKNINFEENQLYAIAYIGYDDLSNLSAYSDYFDQANSFTQYVSSGEYYLIIPRYENMNLKIFENSIETSRQKLIFQQEKSTSFIIQCNESDIFQNVTISFTYEGQTIEFSPYISLKDGEVMVGEYGLNLTK